MFGNGAKICMVIIAMIVKRILQALLLVLIAYIVVVVGTASRDTVEYHVGVLLIPKSPTIDSACVSLFSCM
jgi:hypothetical protein